MDGREELSGSVGGVAREAAQALRRLAAEGRLTQDARAARELCGVLKDALALERELRAEEKSAALVVRFEGGTEEASG